MTIKAYSIFEEFLGFIDLMDEYDIYPYETEVCS